MGLDQAPGFAVHHRVLSAGRWSSRAVAHRPLLLLVAAFVPEGPVVVGIDDSIERRWGAKISARGIYRDPVRSAVLIRDPSGEKEPQAFLCTDPSANPVDVLR